MPWWSVASWFTPSRQQRHHTGEEPTDTGDDDCEPIGDFAVPDDISTLGAAPKAPDCGVSPVTLARIAGALSNIDVRYLFYGFWPILA